jgi:hypothetical protein
LTIINACCERWGDGAVIVCDNCGAEGPRGFINNRFDRVPHADEAEAVKAWDERAIEEGKA